jgi:hypothetical protein
LQPFHQVNNPKDYQRLQAEKRLIKKFVSFFNTVNPDLVTGYGVGDSLGFLLRRAQILDVNYSPPTVMFGSPRVTVIFGLTYVGLGRARVGSFSRVTKYSVRSAGCVASGLVFSSLLLRLFP